MKRFSLLFGGTLCCLFGACSYLKPGEPDENIPGYKWVYETTELQVYRNYELYLDTVAHHTGEEFFETASGTLYYPRWMMQNARYVLTGFDKKEVGWPDITLGRTRFNADGDQLDIFMYDYDTDSRIHIIARKKK